jgi:hypothetical protein
MQAGFGRFLSALVLFVVITQVSAAQKNLKEGKIVYEVYTVDSANFKNDIFNIRFTYAFNKKAKALELNFGFSWMKLINQHRKSEKNILLVNFIEEMYQIKDIDENEFSFSKSMGIDSISSVKYFKNDRRTIKNYPCYRAEITKQNGVVVELYITENLKSLVSDFTGFKLNGLPLEITHLNDDGSKLIIIADEISDNYGDAFDISEEYKEITYEEFKKL